MIELENWLKDNVPIENYKCSTCKNKAVYRCYSIVPNNELSYFCEKCLAVFFGMYSTFEMMLFFKCKFELIEFDNYYGGT